MKRDYFAARRGKIFLAALFLLLPLPASLVYISHGLITIPFGEVLRILASGFVSAETATTQELVIWLIRLPRVCAGTLVGAGLAITGAAYQGIFRNRLADPYMTGVSAGATLGCTIAILLGFDSSVFGLGGITLFSFCGALVTSLLIFTFIAASRRVSHTAILLTGISINLFLSGLVSLLMFLNRDKIETIVLWTMGSLSGLNWQKILFALPLLCAGLTGLFFCARPLDYLVLGSDIARVHGIAVKRSTFLIILFSSLVTSVCVSLSGIVGFVGLLIPNIVRLLFGSRSGLVFAFSCGLGALFLQLADFLARTLLSPAELPLGILTSIIGVPFFIFLVLKKTEQSA
ncbi:MAG: iron ABC transporter permease [Spirochaetales bacterium]|jgi:iron complex transport system permease protein|nr:iron ABC transporter permease [Spirochaetales bacterium]